MTYGEGTAAGLVRGEARFTRFRRLRANARWRRLVRETDLSVDHLVLPLFVRHGEGRKDPVPSMPGIVQYSVDTLVEEARELARLGIPAILLFGIPDAKDEEGSESYAAEGIVQQAVRALKLEVPELLVMTDVCLCAYTSHGHCGLVSVTSGPQEGFEVRNDETLEVLARIAVSHAEAGTDLVGPSDMMDGRVAVIRRSLDERGFENLPIMSYSAKFASSFYGPFREAAGSAPQFGDRRSYQMDPANGDEALREIEQDLAEGADIVMVKPALGYLDLIARAKAQFGCPLAAYNVSGEYGMVMAAAERGWLDERAAVVEILTGIRRAGADLILTYFAKRFAQWA